MIAAFRERVWPIWDTGRLRPFTTLPVFAARAAAAHRLMESGEHIGKMRLVA
jgi:hypothetical protein